jgi:arabinose-5-phosphate isomerase
MTSRADDDLLAQRLARAREVLRVESDTIARLEQGLDGSFSEVVSMVLALTGKVVVTGMGKAGIVGQKISATLASTGTESIFLHPAEALHGDLGRIRPDDLLLALSNSGETSELNQVIPVARKIGARVVAMTGHMDSTLARLADRVLDIGRVDEACPLGLAPTASTSALLALGDALAMVVLSERNFGREDYALYHPAGSLGRRLLRVSEVMRKGAELPLCPQGTSLAEVLRVMGATPGRPGAALITGAQEKLVGIFTDGDLRRLLDVQGEIRGRSPVDEHMGRNPKTIHPDQLVEEAFRVMREHRIDQLAVIDERARPIGLLDVQDLLDTRL